MQDDKNIEGKDNLQQKRKRKLLIATDAFPPRIDGVGRFLIEIVPRLLKEYDITIAAPDFEGNFDFDFKCDIVRFKPVKWSLGDTFFTLATSYQIKKYAQEADLVFVQSLGPIGAAAISAAKKANRPIICYTHVIEWDLATRSLKRLKKTAQFLAKLATRHYYNKCDLLVCPSEETAFKYEKNRIKTKKAIVHLGTDIHKFIPAKDKSQAKTALGLNPDWKIIGYHGRLGREKDLITLYRAFRRLEKKHSNIRLMIVGKGAKDQEQIFSSERNIIFTGPKKDVIPYLQAMDIYVLPSLTETTSLSTMEAMACGLAVITTPVGYIKEYIVERENGMTFPFHNSTRLYMKLDLLLKDEELRQRLGKNARRTIEKRFNWDSTYEKIKQILDSF